MATKDEKSPKNAPLIGIDIGGTGIKGGIVDLKKGKLIGDRFRVPTPQPATPEAVAEELAQEAMLRLWQHAGAYDPARSAVSTWLFRIARNLHIDRVRRESFGLAATAEFPLELAMQDAASAEEHAEGIQLRRRIDALSPVQARLIRMSYFEAKSHQEIASELGMPLGTVKSHLRRALLHLQGEMGETP